MALPMRPRPTQIESAPAMGRRLIRQAAHDVNPDTTPFAPNWVAMADEPPPTLTFARAGRIRLVVSHSQAQSVPAIVYRAFAHAHEAHNTNGRFAKASTISPTKTEGTPPTPLSEWRIKADRKANKAMSDLDIAVYRGMSESPLITHTVTFEALCHALATHQGVTVSEGVLLAWDDVRIILLGFYAPAISEPKGMVAVIESPAYRGIKKTRVVYNEHGHKKTMWQITLAFGSKTLLLQETDPAAVWADAAKAVWKEFGKESQADDLADHDMDAAE